jgi:hypothetical protein
MKNSVPTAKKASYICITKTKMVRSVWWNNLRFLVARNLVEMIGQINTHAVHQYCISGNILPCTQSARCFDFSIKHRETQAQKYKRDNSNVFLYIKSLSLIPLMLVLSDITKTWSTFPAIKDFFRNSCEIDCLSVWFMYSAIIVRQTHTHVYKNTAFVELQQTAYFR